MIREIYKRKHFVRGFLTVSKAVSMITVMENHSSKQAGMAVEQQLRTYILSIRWNKGGRK